MLKIRQDAATRPDGTDEIEREHDDPREELKRLLGEACEVEHSLMLQYLYAGFSVKPRYARLIGEPISGSESLLGVAVQEMEHLAAVNRLLVELGGEPSLGRQDFPWQPGIYPFDLTLERLSQESVARYLYAEAPRGVLDRGPGAPGPNLALVQLLYEKLPEAGRPVHVGSLYGTVLARLDELEQADPDAPVGRWRAMVRAIKEEGEGPHYRFFRDVFLGAHPAFTGDVWAAEPGTALYPSLAVPTNPSGLGAGRGLEGANLRLAALANHAYWSILLLLDLTYRLGPSRGADVRRISVSIMTDVLYPVARALAENASGAPFDPLDLAAAGAGVPEKAAAISRILETASALAGRLGGELGPARTARVTAALRRARSALAVPPQPGGRFASVDPESAPVIVAGAGPAGLAAAAALVSRDVPVRLLECAPVVGGKADSRREGARSVEHGVHGWWPVYLNFDRLMRDMGVEPDEVLEPAAGGDVLTAEGRLEKLQDLGIQLPSPLFAFVHFLRAPFLTLGDVLGSLPFAIHVLAFDHARDYARYDEVSFEDFSTSVGAPERFKRYVLRPFSVSFDYSSSDQVSAASLLSALQFYVLPFQRALIPRWSRGLPQATIFGPIAKAVNDGGGRVDRGHTLESVVIEDGVVVGARLRERGTPADGGGEEVLATIPLSEIPDEGFASLENGSLLVGRQGGEVRAFSAVCPHMWGRVVFEDGRLVCQKHGGEFECSGEVRSRPPRSPLSRHGTRAQGDSLQVLGTRRESAVPCSHLIVATDVEAAKTILHRSEGVSESLLRRVDQLGTTPVIVLRLWFEPGTRVPDGVQTVVIPDPNFADVYFHLNSFDAGYDVEGVVVEVHSADAHRKWTQQPSKEILDAAFQDLARISGDLVRENLRWADAWEIQRHRSVFTHYKPGDFGNRPGADSGVSGLHLAGDWTQAEWSVWMMERAVVSGLRAANRVLEARGLPPVEIQKLPDEGWLLGVSRFGARILRRLTAGSRQPRRPRQTSAPGRPASRG